ncbi:MAG: EAL domain-containing protein [Terracidiphilus sp.]
MLGELVDLRRALDNDEVIPCFQPIVEFKTGRLAGFEVLARWQHSQFGPVLPENFISLAEQNGLIGQLMRQVLKRAFLSASVLGETLGLSVNVSPIQLRDLSLPGQIREEAERAGFPLNRLTVEITESAFLDNLERAKKITGELKTIGCTLALDDFGTGYSSLRHLQQLPFDDLKIDRAFVASMTNTRDSRKIVAAIVGLGHSLGLKTVAEGVETEEQAEILLWLGCELGQGWLYGRPVPAEALPALVEALPHSTPVVLTAPGDGWAVSGLEAMPTQRLAQLQAIYDGAPVGLCFLDRNLRYVSLNKKLAEMNGAPVASHLGRSVKEMFPLWYPNYEPYLLRALQGESIADVEILRQATKPGEPDQTALASYQPAWDESDEVIGVSIAVMDITARKQAEDELESLRESDAHQRYLAEFLKPVPWIMDAEGNSVQVSSLWVPATKMGVTKMRNLGWLEALHEDDLAPTIKTMREALRTGKPIDIEYRVKDVDGEWKWMRSRGVPRLGASGEIIRWYGSVEDLGKPWRAENALQVH